MLNLDATIERLVDDVLRAVVAHALRSLHDVLSPLDVRLPRGPLAHGNGRRRSRDSTDVTRARNDADRHATAPGRSRSRGASTRHGDDAHGAEITDPDGLLAIVPAAAAERDFATKARYRRAHDSVRTSRPSDARPVQLRAGEHVVRASGAGIVIRRKKRV